MPHATRPAPCASPAVSPLVPAATQLSVRPGQTLLVCLPPGASLVVEHGCLALRAGPVVWGQVLASQARLGTLEAGQCRTGAAESTEWMEVSNPGHTTAHAKLLEPAPVLSSLAGLVRACLNRLGGGMRTLRAHGRPRPGTPDHGQRAGAHATTAR
ncbi:hypothetical protein FRC97_14600 [Paracidovorax citrulli]|uniref:hypothetical protein n=1 Tax=Paracidovorax citrulli TaxID=80869 RepID=UPI0005FBEB93|nr:hypothetical protein [Paracidovorax citrulli]QCX09425.1 hypothetical protein APS58_0471 [Paracidovorax citrulli]UMT89152.1 hypothetical protein FRC90_14480 [Paracidovorax citrulli]UMT96130.1 hypothetical protein FRC97_14600 [Paracidovorax citrulli]SDK77496.1 hypothetical protein SAMN04489709_12343 [Paracidovorax citrulli]